MIIIESKNLTGLCKGTLYIIIYFLLAESKNLTGLCKGTLYAN